MGGLSNLAVMGLNLALQAEAMRRSDRRLRKEERARRKQLVARLEAERREEAERLARRMAAERARAGAAGVAAGASFEAVLKGLERASEEAIEDRARALGFDLQALDRVFRDRRRRNLLERGEKVLALGRDLLAPRGRRRRLLP